MPAIHATIQITTAASVAAAADSWEVLAPVEVIQVAQVQAIGQITPLMAAAADRSIRALPKPISPVQELVTDRW